MFKVFQRTQPLVTHPPAVGSYNGMTLSDWQHSTPHIQWMRDQMQTPRFRDLLAVLSNARPSTTLSHITDTEAAVALGRRIGYDEILGIILSLASHPLKDTPDIQADYGAADFDLQKTT